MPQFLAVRRSFFWSAASLAVPLLWSSLWLVPAAQSQTELRQNDTNVNNCEFGKSLQVFVLNSDKKRLDRQSIVRVTDQKRDFSALQTTTEESEIYFCNLDYRNYDIEVSAVGYLTGHKTVSVTGGILDIKVEIVLQKDPTAVDLNGPDDALPPKARKDAKRAVYSLKSGKLKEAQRDLEKVYQLAPNSGQTNFLLGYLYLQLKDVEKSESYLNHASVLDPHRIQTLVLLGRVQLQREHYPDAQKTLEQAVSTDSGDWMAHNLLADAYLYQLQYEQARDQAQLAIEKGSGAASEAQLVLGQALANLGHDKEALDALNGFVQSNAKNPVVPQIKDLITRIEKRDAEGATAAPLTMKTDLALAASQPTLPESAWGPPGIDDQKPVLASNVTCPYDKVMEGTALRLKQLVDNMTRFAAIEDLVHQQLDKVGNPISKETRKFDYVATISEPMPGYVQTDEFRNLRYGVADLPDHIVTSGFVSLAFVFHPSLRDNFQMTCEGLGEWHNQATWLMYFRQRDDKPSRIGDYIVGSDHYPLKLKGRAWITADNYQIAHIESDLVDPLPNLPVQHQIADYGPVEFGKKNIELWLPQHVDIYLEFNRHYYHRQHSFDHFMLFSVDSKDSQPLNKNQPGGTVQNQ